MKTQLKICILIFSGILLYFPLVDHAQGHGIGYEVLPPVPLGDKMVSLEVTSSQYDDPDNSDREIQFSLFDVETGITIRDVTYGIEGKKGDIILFDEKFVTGDGIFVFDLLQSDSDEITLTKENTASFFESIVGLEKEVIKVEGSPFNTGGLYTFKVDILTAESLSNKLEPPIRFDVGLSIPDRTYYNIQDLNFGKQQLSVITYYDIIEDFEYDSNERAISFSMPFNWSFDNINQTSVIHEEITIPKSFGDLLVPSYSTWINGHQVSERVITIDEFSEKQRIVHIILNQNDLFELLEKEDNDQRIDFLLKPKDGEFVPLSTVTGNGQYRIHLDWEPKDIRSNSEIRFQFDVTDVFLKGRPVSTSYEIAFEHDENEFYRTSGTSIDSREEHNIVDVSIPDNISGPVSVKFENMGGNSLAKVTIPVIVNRISSDIEIISIPDWVRNNAGWWADGQIGDSDFASGIEFMIKERIIQVPVTNGGEKNKDSEIPDWVRNNAGWWADGQISDKDFAGGLEYLIKNGIIAV